jgi:hypothetical protein
MVCMMTRQSQRIPVDEWTREVSVREVDGAHVLVMVDHAGNEETVPVRLREVPQTSAVTA